MLETTDLRRHFTELAENKWTILTYDRAFCLKLRENARGRMGAGFFRPAELASARHVVSEIRNDKIFWLDGQPPSSAVESEFINELNSLTTVLKKELRVSLSEIECHYAHYEKNHFYKKHRDTTSLNNKRVFSFVLYLNENWQPNDGGHLVGYEGANTLFDVEPLLGRMILFRSDVEHEVQPTMRDRLSLTGWFRC